MPVFITNNEYLIKHAVVVQIVRCDDALELRLRQLLALYLKEGREIQHGASVAKSSQSRPSLRRLGASIALITMHAKACLSSASSSALSPFVSNTWKISRMAPNT